MGMRPPLSLSYEPAPSPQTLCSIRLRMTSLIATMHLWNLCIEVRDDSLGGERCNLLLFMVVVVVVNVVVVVLL